MWIYNNYGFIPYHCQPPNTKRPKGQSSLLHQTAMQAHCLGKGPKKIASEIIGGWKFTVMNLKMSKPKFDRKNTPCVEHENIYKKNVEIESNLKCIQNVCNI